MNDIERHDRIMVNEGLIDACVELKQDNLHRAILMVIKGSHIRAVDFINGDKVIADFMERIIDHNYEGAIDYLKYVISENKKELNNDKNTD